jgi:ankyrin repeat protein
VACVVVKFTSPFSDCCRDIDEDQQTAIHIAAEEGQVETLRLLIDKGADVEARSMCHFWNFQSSF